RGGAVRGRDRVRGRDGYGRRASISLSGARGEAHRARLRAAVRCGPEGLLTGPCRAVTQPPHSTPAGGTQATPGSRSIAVKGGDHRTRIFGDRREAGRLLGEALKRKYAGRDVVVLGLPRRGGPSGDAVARRLGAPFNAELALGAIASGGVRFLDDDSMTYLGLDELDIEGIVTRERAELERRERLYRSGRGSLDLRGKTVMLVDDGIATGSTMA